MDDNIWYDWGKDFVMTLMNIEWICAFAVLDETLPINVFCGVVAGVVGSVVSNPTDVLKVGILHCESKSCLWEKMSTLFHVINLAVFTEGKFPRCEKNLLELCKMYSWLIFSSLFFICRCACKLKGRMEEERPFLKHSSKFTSKKEYQDYGGYARNIYGCTVKLFLK